MTEALTRLRADGWKLAILSNTDADYLDASIARLGVEIDERVVASEIGSYKPGHRHWDELERRTDYPEAHVHVAASLFHDIEPCADLEITAVWINRLGERSRRGEIWAAELRRPARPAVHPGRTRVTSPRRSADGATSETRRNPWS